MPRLRDEPSLVREILIALLVVAVTFGVAVLIALTFSGHLTFW
jgi:hypothetical protein